jgi:hypothetical protein
MLRYCFCFALFVARVSSAEPVLITELTWVQHPAGIRDDRVDYFLSVGDSQWHVGEMTHGNGGEYFVANHETEGVDWEGMVRNLVNESGSQITLSSTGQSGDYESTLPMQSLSGHHLDRLEFELYDFAVGRVDLLIYGTDSTIVPEPNSLISIPILAAGFLLRRRARAFA